MRAGLVSDTHGLLDPRLERLFAGCDLILHGGDVGRQLVLDGLAAIAAVHAVRGNNDLGPLGESLPESLVLRLGELKALLLHDLGSPARPAAPARRALAGAGAHLVLHGHSHRPAALLHGGVLFVNPGSAGPKRFSLPRTAGVLTVEGRSVQVELFDLSGVPPASLGEPLRAAL
jgi:uncharacterized protein